jgi:outer membrane protein OmpA-like peptidoglycan-associated protein
MRVKPSLIAALVMSWAAWNGAEATASGQVGAAGTTRTMLAIRYEEGKTTEVLLDGTSASPRVRGKAKVEAEHGHAAIEVELKDVAPASTFGTSYTTYVLWGITPEGQTTNLGEFPWKGDMKLRATLPVQRFGLLVTAEPYGAVTSPSSLMIAQNSLKPGETVASTGEISYRGDDGRLYVADSATEVPFDRKTPVPVAAARLSVKVAERAGAATYARGELAQASEKLAQMEAAYKDEPKKEGAWGSFARETTRLAQTARINAGNRRAEIALAEERQSQMQALEKAKADATSAAEAARLERERAEAERRAAELATAEQRAAAMEAARAQQAATTAQQQTELAKQQADQAQQQALKAQQEAEHSQQQAQQSQQQAEEAQRQAAEAAAERDRLRQQLEQSLSAILETTREARGLVVNLGDVLFDFGKSTLRPEAREKLSRMAGVLLAYPAPYTLEFEGHTDSVGSDEFNMKLSQDRAEAVRDYVLDAGIKPDRVIRTRGLGKTSPVASNETDEGRRRNRRVEIVINDQPKSE